MTDQHVQEAAGTRSWLHDHGDGTGTRTTYDEHGNETSSEQLTGLLIPDLLADPDLIPPNTTRLRSPR